MNLRTPLKEKDAEIDELIKKEIKRQETELQLIASENYTSQAVLEAQGSILTNKYAEGYPFQRYYGGCEVVDAIETLAIQRACQLFKAESANVQPHSGTQANLAVYLSLMRPGEKLMGMRISEGGHLTHGHPANLSGKLFEVFSYGVHPQTHRLDYEAIRQQVKKMRPKVLVAGASAYPRIIDFKILGNIAQESEAYLVVDMAHIAGLVAAGIHPSPIPYATCVTSTTHKTLRGPRGGLILCKQEMLPAINSMIFPGTQGGPFMHSIAGKAVCFHEALSSDFQRDQKQVIQNAQALAQTLLQEGLQLITQGTDTHLMLVDLSPFEIITGKDAEQWLHQAGITVNKNLIPHDKRSPALTTGIRIGVPALTTRGMKTSEMKQIGQWIAQILHAEGKISLIQKIRKKTQELCSHFPLYT